MKTWYTAYLSNEAGCFTDETHGTNKEVLRRYYRENYGKGWTVHIAIKYENGPTKEIERFTLRG